MSENKKLVLVLVALLIMAPFVWMFWSIQPEEREISQAERDASNLRYECRERLAGVLHDPSSAQWGIRDD